MSDAPATPPSRRITGRFTAEHVSATLEEFLLRASTRGEAAVAAARGVLCALLLLRILLAYGDELFALEVKPWFAAAGLSFGLAFSLHTLRRLRAPGEVRLRLTLSVLVDTLVVIVALSPIVVWPHGDYRGVLREFDAAGILLVVVATGARLYPRVAVVGAASNALALTGFLLLDHVRHRELVGYPAGDVILAYALLVGAATLAFAVAKGTRLLVAEGAEAVLKAERARQRLGVYVSEEVAAALDTSDDDPALGGARREVAVLFSDLRGFTRFAEKLEPEALVGELNAYLDAMVTAVRAEGGVIDKFIGDAVMALFGVPQARPDAAAAAVRAAAGMQRALRAHNEARARAGRPPLAHGIGVHFGPCVWGNIGTQERMQYTVIGDAVNLASRLESASKELGVPVVISADAAAQLGYEDRTPVLAPRGTLQVRGREQALEVFTFVDPELS
ncbi:MAG: adenylate/guanylate cyclase domain-containing protein [Planctomycetes bacterium]|nr:adenylate/guanylate cyclase domain-containing protein [Planctomycetota bacterium]